MATLLGCSDERYDEQQVAQQKKEISLQNELDLVGAWESEDLKIEFHGSHYNRVFPNQLVQQSQVKTGRLIEDGKTKQFHWSLDGSSGVITVNMINSTCTIIPIDYCEVASRRSIELTGSDITTAQWAIKLDSDLDGVIDETMEAKLTRVDLSAMSTYSGKLFFKQSKNFDRPLIAEFADNQLNIILPISAFTTHLYGTFSGDLAAAEDMISLEVKDRNDITEKVYFKVSDNADRLLEVKTTLSDVTLRKGIGTGFIIDYKIQREIKLPNDLTADMLDLSQFKKSQYYTTVFNEVVSLNNGMSIDFDTTYYSKIPAGFAHTADGAGSEITFNIDNTGVIAYTDPSNVTQHNQQAFHWQYKDDQEIQIEFANGATWSMGFTGNVLGGKTVVLYNEGHDTISHDFLNRGYVDPMAIVPGQFKLENTDLSQVDVTFKDNGEIVIQAGPISLGGFWEMTEEGDIISFECDTKDGAIITELAHCRELMAQVSSEDNQLKFGHIRKFTFLHQEGNSLVSSYNATAWGGQFTRGDNVEHFNWVYRWTRVGDDHSE